MRRAAILPFIFFLSTLARAQDFQQWNEVDLTASWHKVDFLVPLLARTDTYLPNPQLAATGVVGDFTVKPHLLLSAGYLYADLPQIPDSVHLPLVAVTPVCNVGRFTSSAVTLKPATCGHFKTGHFGWPET